MQFNTIPAIETLSEGVVIVDNCFNIKYVNSAFEKLNGLPREHLVGQNLSNLGQTWNPKFLNWIKNILKTGKSWKDEIKKVRAFAVKENLDENSYNYVFICQTNLQTNKEMLHAQRMQAIGTMVSGIAHDFNNILTGILGFAELALKDLPPNHPASRKIEYLIQSACRARELIRQILHFVREDQEGETKAISCSTMLKEVLKFIRAAMPSEIEIKTEILSESYAAISPSEFYQVMVNLCINAYQAMEPLGGGTLTVTLQDTFVDAHKAKEVNLAPGKYVKIEVSDTGPGISPEIINHIFEPFFTTKKDKGTGLGLAVVHKIIQENKGAIIVKSQVGQGTTFMVYLPQVQPKISPIAASSENIKSTKQGEILLVDDELAVLEVQKDMLTSLGYKVVACSSAEEALNEIKKSAKSFDAVITDLSMPKVSGEKLARQIRMLCPQIPIILCTGFGNLIVEERLQDINIQKILTKPVTLKEFAEALNEVLK